MVLTIVQNASLAQMTSTGQRLALSYTKAPDGSDIRVYAPVGGAFPCNLQPLKGDQVPLPLANLDLKMFNVHVQPSVSVQASDHLSIDGVIYVVQDIDDVRSGTQISRTMIVSGVHT